MPGAGRSSSSRYDLLLAPTVPLRRSARSAQPRRSSAGAPIDVDRDPWWQPLLAANITGGAAISVPMGLGDDGLPLGMQIIGPRFAERRCLAAAAALEAITPWPRRVALGGGR